MISKAFLRASELLASIHGKPLPKTLLSFGDEDSGWYIRLNNGDDDIPSNPPCTILAKCNGWPACVLSPCGGVILGNDSESDLIKWLEDQLNSRNVKMIEN